MSSGSVPFGLATVRQGSEPSEVALVLNGLLYPLSSLQPSLQATTVLELLCDWEKNLLVLDSLAESISPESPSLGMQDVQFETPIQYPKKLLAVGANYTSHLKEMGLPAEKWNPMPFFSCPPTTTIVGPGRTVKMPTGTKQFDWECEMTVVVGSRLSHATSEEAARGIAGYTIGLDLSCRDLLSAGPIVDIMRGKAQVGMKPCGPIFWPKECVANVKDMSVKLYVNEELMIDGSTNEMIWSPEDALAEISRFVTLEPGDMVMTGTPAGSAKSHGERWLRVGDRIRAEIGGLGSLAVEVVDQ